MSINPLEANINTIKTNVNTIKENLYTLQINNSTRKVVMQNTAEFTNDNFKNRNAYIFSYSREQN